MSNFPIVFTLDLPGLPEEKISLSSGGWDLLQKFQTMKTDKGVLFKVPAYLRSLREKAGLSRMDMVKKAESWGLECTFEQVRHWEKSPPVMEKLVLAARLLNTTPLAIIAEAMGWNFSPEEVDETRKVYVAFGQRLSPNGHKDLRQLKAQNKKLDQEINRAIRAERYRQSRS